MYQINFSHPVNIHFIGIGGSSMNGLAQMLHAGGFTVTGSDSRKSKITMLLENLGITVLYGQRPSNITNKIECVVYTAAVKSDNPEYEEAVRLNLPLIDRAELLGQIMKHYGNAICISGIHGKTTVTSMMSLILKEAGLNPAVNVGGILNTLSSNVSIQLSDYFVVESCEYTNSFLKFHPKHEIILNIEAEHLDFFKGIEDIRSSFRLFAEKVPKDGTLVINSSIDNYKEIAGNLSCNVVTYGIIEDLNEASADIPDYYASDIVYNELGHGEFNLYKNKNLLYHIKLSVIGLHNISNAVSAAALSDVLDIPFDAVQRAFLSFKGTERRFELKGELGGVTIIDDYAHHPTEIAATLTSAKRCSHNKIWCVFQPHTYTRTKSLLPELAKSLSEADYVVLTDIYAAREKNIYGISSNDLYDELQKLGVSSYYYKSFDEIENFLLQNCTNGDMLITMGAGDVYMIGETLLGK